VSTDPFHCMERTSETYTVKLLCSNCGYEGKEDIPAGTKRKEGPVTCPICDCRTARQFPR
jgi:hypothetical protein